MKTNSLRSGGWITCLLLAWLAWIPASAATASLADCDRDAHFSVQSASADRVPAQASAVWLSERLIRWPGVGPGDRFRLYYSAGARITANVGAVVQGADGFFALTVSNAVLPAALAARFNYLGNGIQLELRESDLGRSDSLWQSQVLLAQEDGAGRVQRVTHLQWAAAFDVRFAAAATLSDLGVSPDTMNTRFRLWAPSAQSVAICLYTHATTGATRLLDMARDPLTGSWVRTEANDLRGQFYTYLVDVYVRGHGLVRNRVTDPYALGLSANSTRSAVIELDDAASMPARWSTRQKRPRIRSATDMVIYELHVRDFSANDATVASARRGKYLAFTDPASAGMRHLAALAEAGLTDIHLLPVFDFATVPETGCITPDIPAGAADSSAPQSAIQPVRDRDCFNWGYDPLHFTAPEGSYASDADDAYARVREFRAMVQALHRAGLRVGMDVVYNHTSAAGQDARSVLDRIVPGYYQRLNAQGAVETSTCCQNTATEHRMMAKLMIDSAVVWARDYRIDSFRFDLMAHQPRAVMESLQVAVDEAAGRSIQLLGEGWNFGEVANGARFVQASQLSLNGSGIGTFSDRARDAVRGGSAMDNDARLLTQQGYVNGLFYDRNADAANSSVQDLMRLADLVRVGLAGSIRSYDMLDHRGQTRRLEQIDYGGQAAGYVSAPNEVVNYVENHDNQTLFDINAYKLPAQTSRVDRARVQMLAAAINLFSQGTPYFHAGIDTLRSKSLDRNSYDSGDWFNRIDWSYQDNYFGTGLPPQSDNGSAWPMMRPVLANTMIKPTASEIRWARDQFRDLLRIRLSSGLFRLRTAEDIRARLSFPNSGPNQLATVLVGHLDGEGLADANFRELIYFVNVDRQAQTLDLPVYAGKSFNLHPVQRDRRAADLRVRKLARYAPERGSFHIPARSAVVFVRE